METIRTEQLWKSYKGVFRLGPLDLRVAPGEILGVMGPTGAGKTTLLRLLWGFIRPDQGHISVFGVQPHLEQVKVRSRAGYLSKNPQFYSAFTAKQFLGFVAHFYEGCDPTSADCLLKEFAVPADVKIQELSKGHRIKLGLISAVAHRPSLLILDEPTSGLDPLVRREILRFLKKIARQDRVSIVLSSNLSDDLDQLASSVLMLNDGKTVEYADAAGLQHKYGQSRLEAIFVSAVGSQHHP